MRTVKLASLVLDFDLYPRTSVNSHHVAELRKAAVAGASLPPLVIDKKSHRIVDGFHRYRVYKRLYGTDCEVEVVERNYASDQSLFLDAMRLNAVHGLRMDTCDKTHCILIAQQLKIDDRAIASALTIDPKYVGKLRVDRTAVSGKLHVPLKRTIRHKAGRRLTRRQQAANEKLSGMNQVFYVNQLILLIETDLLDTADEELMGRLEELQSLIEGLKV